MITDPPRIDEVELQPVLAKGDLVVDGWWRPDPAAPPAPLHRRFGLEVFALLLPLAFCLIYQFLIAAPRYVSESEFMVRTLAANDMGNLATLLTDQKITRASDETFAVSQYMISRDAVDTLVAHDRLRDMLSRRQADFVNRFPNMFGRDTREQLFRHFKQFASIEVSNDSGIATLRAVAFAPDDALALNKAMLRNAEGFVNRLNARIFSDSLSLAERDLETQKAKFAEIETRLTNYRNTQNLLDPNKEVADGLTRIGALMTKLSTSESELAQTTSLVPRSPALAGLASQVAALRDQIASERQRLSGQHDSLAAKFAEFDRIMLDRALASKQLESALAQYDQARQDLSRQHFYLQTVVEPYAPDQAALPRRFVNTALIAGFSLAVYLILRAILKNVREHIP